MGALIHLFGRLRKGLPWSAFPWESYNKICTVLEGLQGVGCHVEKSADGRDWTIVVDGASDYAPEDFAPPWTGAGPVLARVKRETADIETAAGVLVELYANGKDAAPTGEAVVYAPSAAWQGSTVRGGSWLLVFPAAYSSAEYSAEGV